MIIIWILIIVFVVWLLTREKVANFGRTDNEEALKILKAMFAKGEIDEKEFNQRKKVLKD